MTKKTNVEKDLVSAAAAPARARRRPAASSKKHVAVEQAGSETKSAKSTSIAREPSREEIARLAFLYWEARGHQSGCAEEDWLRAEQELRRG
jgi:hypothetical protein